MNFFKPILSSITSADTPAFSRDFTKYGICSILPPLSPSNIIGLVVTSVISFNELILSNNQLIGYLGFPLRAESVKLDDHIPSNSENLFFLT